MNRIIQFTLFISMFLLVFFFLHLYVFFRFSDFFNIKRNAYFFIVMGLFAISYPLTSFLERTINGFVSKTLYIFSSIWIGVLFLLFSSLIVYEIVNLLAKLTNNTISKYYAGTVILILIIIVTAYSLVNSMLVTTKTVNINIDGLKSNITAVQLTDIHIGTIQGEEFLQDIVKKTNELNPDVVFITGDLVDGSGLMYLGMFDALNNLNAPAFFVIGNHEGYEGLDKVFNILNKTNITILRNEVVDFKDVQIVGVDYSDSKNYLGVVLSNLSINKSKPSILLYHNPVSLDSAVDAGINLQLSGHTHNGQLFPFNLLVKLVYKYTVGLHDYKEMKIYISSGTGTWGPPMRLGSSNEITLINLKSK